MKECTTNATSVQQTTLAKNPERLTTPINSSHAPHRNLMRRLNPRTPYVAATDFNDTLSLFIAPRQGAGRGLRKDTERLASKLANPHIFPSQIEIEFSASPADAFPAAEGLPEDYRQSAIDWALGLSSAVVIAVDRETDGATVEPYAVLRPVQAVFRCNEEAVSAWSNYLGRRVRPRQRFAVLRMEDMA